MAECLPSTLNMNTLPTVRVKLSVPPLSEIVEGKIVYLLHLTILNS